MAANVIRQIGLAALTATTLTACVAGGGGTAPGSANPILGDEIESSSIDAPPTDGAAPEGTEPPADATAPGTDDVAAAAPAPTTAVVAPKSFRPAIQPCGMAAPRWAGCGLPHLMQPILNA
jgi:hypothetical protein